MSARPTWFYRHAVVTVLASALFGAAIGLAVAIGNLPHEGAFHPSELLRLVGALAVAGGSLLVGLLVGILLVRAGQSGLECPRCGTLNAEGADECSACGLSLG